MAQENPSPADLRVVPVERRSAVLRHPGLPCLARDYTINLTSGCPHECCYCYAQSFAQHPGWGKVRFYANSLEILRRQLARRREPPRLVFFSTACEPFVPRADVLDCLHGVMELLLSRGVFLLISTKRPPPERFVELFAAHPGLVCVQVGLTTLDDEIRRLLEPRAPSVGERLRGLRELVAGGVAVEMRADPLIPGLTDSPESFDRLCAAAGECGATRGVASHLFLRAANRHMLALRHGAWSVQDMARLYTHGNQGFCGQGTIWLPPTDYRRRVLSELRSVAAAHGIHLRLCSCTNQDVAGGICHPTAPEAARCRQQVLF